MGVHGLALQHGPAGCRLGEASHRQQDRIDMDRRIGEDRIYAFTEPGRLHDIGQLLGPIRDRQILQAGARLLMPAVRSVTGYVRIQPQFREVANQKRRAGTPGTGNEEMVARRQGRRVVRARLTTAPVM